MKRILGMMGLGLLGLMGCNSAPQAQIKPRLVLFVGLDVSGSFQKGPHAQDSKDFLAWYLHAHLNGLGGLEKPHTLFVGPLGGFKVGEPKTFHPIQAFEGKNVAEIRAKLEDIFPAGKYQPNTDFNAFIEHAASILRSRNLALKPVSVVMLGDGKVDVSGSRGKKGYRHVNLGSLERLSRNVSLRLLYTNPESGLAWREKVPRRRVKVWTQDAEVMASWKDPKIFAMDGTPESQEKLYAWIKDNVDYSVRAQRIR